MKRTVLILAVFFISFANFADEEIKCCFYKITVTPSGTGPDISLASDFLKKIDADIIVLAGIEDSSQLAEIAEKLPGIKFQALVNATNKSSHIAILAKLKPEKFTPFTNVKYKIKKKEFPVLCGYLYAMFNINGYLLHVFGADLKDRLPAPDVNQYDMRRYEARALRKLITATIKADKKHNANILLLACLNDTCGRAPVKDVYNRRFAKKKQLYDVRPLDSGNVSWTELDSKSDEYNRIDYIIASYGVLPELLLRTLRIPEFPDWNKASSHRPLCINIVPDDKPEWSEEHLNSLFPNTIRRAH